MCDEKLILGESYTMHKLIQAKELGVNKAEFGRFSVVNSYSLQIAAKSEVLIINGLSMLTSWHCVCL